jgi:predicted short-subunit dehydrogenase-like oxidoreductase (DUF2520 family)
MQELEKTYKIGFIGSGKVATALAKAFHNNGLQVLQIYSPNKDHSTKLARIINAKALNSIEEFDKEIDIIIISTTDTALLEIDFSKINKSTLICHTSGSVGIEVFKAHKNYGVFYPLQTFSNQKQVDIQKVPICIEANNSENLSKLMQLANIISQKVEEVDSAQRESLHLAAVFVCNFTNAMYSIGEEILEKSNISFDLLRPLINETAMKVQEHSPKEVQTGPAIRNDKVIMNKHIDELKSLNNYSELYELMSKIISKK